LLLSSYATFLYHQLFNTQPIEFMASTKILLVEDNAINQLIVSTCLRKWGMMVTVANHGKEALVLIQSRDFQLVLMDLQMPEMDGYESTSKIRSMEDPYFKTVPIISFSASSMIDTKEKALQYGMTDFIGKPLMMDELRNKIDTYTMHTHVKQSSSSFRPLFVDFKLHADDDPDFKLELIELMIGNLSELRSSLELSRKENNPEIYLRACHKVKVSLTLLNDQEFTDAAEELKNPSTQARIDLFNKLCDDIIKSLKEEKSDQLARS